MSNFTYTRLGTTQMGSVTVGDVKLDSGLIESKLDKIYNAIADNQISVEVPQPTAQVEVFVDPVIVAEIDWKPLAEILTHTKAPIIHVQPAEIAFSPAPGPVILQESPKLVAGVYAIAILMACLLTLIAYAFYLHLPK